MQWDFQLQISTYCIDNNLWSGEKNEESRRKSKKCYEKNFY